MLRRALPIALLALLQAPAALAAPYQEESNEESIVPGAERYGRWIGTIEGLREPSAVEVAPSGLIWVAEEVADRVRAFTADGEQVRTLGGPGALSAPTGLAVSGDGSVFVAEGGAHRIRRFDAEGGELASFGGWGAAAGELNGPRGLALHGERLFVADERNHRVQAFSLSGEFLLQLGGYGAGEGRLNRPAGVAVDDEGNLYVADTGNHRVQKFGPAGELVRAWGDFGPYPGFFADPTDITWHAGRVFVGDRDNHRVQVFTSEGELLYEWGDHALLPREAGGKVHYPERLSVAPDGAFVAVAESFEDRVQLFAPWPGGVAPDGNPLRFERQQSAHYGSGISIAGRSMALVEPSAPSMILWDLELESPVQVNRYRVYGRGFGQLLRPVDAAIDLARGWVHVADPGNRRLVTYGFRPRGEGEELKYDPFLVRMVRSLDLDRLGVPAGLGVPLPIDPLAVAVAPDGRIFVADVSNRAVFVVSPELELLGRLDDGGVPFVRPVDVSLDRAGGELLVVDQLAGHVRRFALQDGGAASTELEPLGGGAAELGGLLRPAGALVLADGRVWVSDEGRHRLALYSAEGGFERHLGGPGLLRGEFHKPRGMAQDGRGRVVVIDWGNHRGQILDGEGNYLAIFGARLFTRPARLQK